MNSSTAQRPLIRMLPGLRANRIVQALLLIAFWQIGDAVARASGLPIPGAILGLFLVLGLLGTGRLRLQTVDRGAAWFVGEMLLFFVPPVLAVLDHPELLGVLGLKLLAAIVVGTLIVMTVTAVTIDVCYRLLVPARIDAAR
jgi:holin-like protein